MPEFTQSWAFAFLFGCFIGAIIGFFVAALCAASSKGSRMEEKIENCLFQDQASIDNFCTKLLAKYKGKPVEVVTKNDPRTD